MSKHLYVNATYITNGPKPWPDLLECGTKEYLIKRVQFWKWRLHRTMGRPVLLLRKPLTKSEEQEKNENE